MFENIEILNDIIVGRVEPYIYAFSTNTIPNYLKVGDTYRPVSARLKEWKKHFPSLLGEFADKAMVNADVFFRDYSVHQYLENELRRERLNQDYVHIGTYFSNEFFKQATTTDIRGAVSDIKSTYENGVPKYQYYNSINRLPETYTYVSTGIWTLRPNQEEAVRNFLTAIENDRTNLLMYAVMRFGKSFTSLCCAKEMNAKIVLIVSAKADVREEWKKTVQSADNFNSNYMFLCSDDLNRDQQIVKNTVSGGKGAVVFLTLQDLQGDEIKEKHQEVFGNAIDLLIIDETHYGARAEKYGQILKSQNYVKDVKDKYSSDDFVELDLAIKQLKILDARIRLHLSGTPYRILMGSEFTKDDIITFVQFSDIVKAQEEWDDNNILSDEKKEWENPYYGFPQMVRFAFNPSTFAMQKLQELKSTGTTYAFSALFKPQSIKKSTDGKHKKFVFEKEVLNLFEVIDGSKEDVELLSFLNYRKIKDGKMCRHIVCVLPYCASCDALENLLTANSDKFKNLRNYTILNISGIDKPNAYKTVQSVKAKIKAYEDDDKKTITLTVNRMLTGSTVEQWDTMLFLKDTASPQEYDQAVFRLQNQYVKVYANESGDIIKYNMKPQTLLVDFDPHRMFSMQEQKSLIYNANTDEGGNQRLQERMEEELRISPIITINKNKIKEVQATDILEAVSAYSKDRGVMDETREIPIDLSLQYIDKINREIEKQSELGSKQGLQLNAYEGAETDLDVPVDLIKPVKDNDGGDTAFNTDTTTASNYDGIEKFKNKFRMFYSRLLFFSFLSENILKSLDDILDCIKEDKNARIAQNLALEEEVLLSIRKHINVFVLSQLDYKIQNINNLSHDENVEPVERAITAIKKFGKLSESEITTPTNICDEMIELLPDDCFYRLKALNIAILDISCKIGEFPIAICKRCASLGIDVVDIRNSILAITTSLVAYEFTRKIYEILGLNTDCIACEFTSYDLLNIQKVDDRGIVKDDIDYEKASRLLKQKKKLFMITLKDEINEDEGEKMKFEAIVGNPPYQMSDGGGGIGTSAKPAYDKFVQMAKATDATYISMIIKANWMTGGKGLARFRNDMLTDKSIIYMKDYFNAADVFPNVDISGGICYFLRNKNIRGDCEYVSVKNGSISTMQRPLINNNSFVRFNEAVSIVNKVNVDKTNCFGTNVAPRKPFGLPTNIKIGKECFENHVKVYAYPSDGYISKSKITKNHSWLGKYKVCVANVYGERGNFPYFALGKPFIIEPNACSSETYIVLRVCDQEKEALNVRQYVKTKFFRFLVLLIKNTPNATRRVYHFVPLQDFSVNSDVNWDKSIAEIDKQLYEKYGFTDYEVSFIESMIKPME